MNKKTIALVHVEHVEPEEVIWMPSTAQTGLVDQLVTALVSKPKKWQYEREIQDLMGELQVELTRLKAQGMVMQRQMEIEHVLLKLKDKLERDRAVAQTVGDLEAVCQTFEEIESILYAGQVMDPELQATLQRSRRRLIQQILEEM